MNFEIDELKVSGAFNEIDFHLADFICGKAGKKSGLLYMVILLLSNRLSQGDVCLVPGLMAGRPVSDFTQGALPGEYDELLIPDEDEIISTVRESGIAGGEGDMLPVIIDEKNRIYFHKYFFYEKSLADSITGLAAGGGQQQVTPDVKDAFRRLFPRSGGETDWQAAAAWSSLNSRFTVISGGPGTGKTSTVIRILALLVEISSAGLSVALAAPTGKAAARLSESIALSIGDLPVSDDVKKVIPREASTIHRLLGAVSGSTEFRHGRENPLGYDVIVVDECSMADLALMYRFFDAVKSGARVILLGDRDQLSSVEGGAVFGDICDSGREHGCSAAFIKGGTELLGENFASDCASDEAPGPLNDSMTILRRSYRFSGTGGIGLFSEMARSGNSSGALELLKQGASGDLVITGRCEAGVIEAAFREAAGKAFGDGEAPLHEEVLNFIKGFAILTATRKGEYGAASLNGMAELVLAEMGVIYPRGVFYEGRPVMVTRNDYGLSLFNGDIGVACSTDEGLRVMFNRPDGSRVYVHPSRMPGHETAFAMTIHKSQGSEFDDVLVVLPPGGSSIMTRELLYTAVTRAKGRVALASDAVTVAAMIDNPMRRMTGLRERLWGAT